MLPIPQWLASAREFHAASFGPQSGPISITISDQAGNELSWSTAGALTPSSPMLSPMEAEILRAIGTGAIKGAAIASRIGRAYDAGLKTILANLVERGALAKCDAGYRSPTSRTAESDQC